MLGRSSWRFFIHFNLKKKEENKKKNGIQCKLEYWMLPLLTFELVLADQFCMVIYKKKNILWHWGLWIWWLDVMETLIRCGPWQKMLCQRRWRIFFFQTDFFVLLYKINWVLEALSYVIQWDLWILSINQ